MAETLIKEKKRGKTVTASRLKRAANIVKNLNK